MTFALAGCASVGPSPDASPSPGALEPVANTSVASDSPDQYVLGEGDRISIQVFDEPDLTLESRVGASGFINYSYLGNLTVAGKSAEQIEREIIEALEDGYLVNPSVNVSVIEYRPFFINGEVRQPGSYPYQPGLTLDKAIALAGGLTDRASTGKMYVTKGGLGSEERKARMSTKLQPGDIVSIKEGFF